MTGLPVTLVTGALGSGKTTFLNRLLRQPGYSRAFVIVNEDGEVALDHALSETGSDKSVQLAGGCACCSARSDLIDLLRDLFLRRVRGQVAEFDRVIIETSGEADPAAIVESLKSDPITAARYRIDEVIGVIDATVDSVGAAAARAADRYVLSKTDPISPEDARRISHELQKTHGVVRIDA
jgi:G3E family GTPase